MNIKTSRLKSKLRNLLIVGLTLILLLFIYVQYDSEDDESDSILKSLTFQWRSEFGELNGPDISATDPRVIKKLENQFLFTPSGLRLNLTDKSETDPSMGQSNVIKKIFRENLLPGFFIECGALDGETRSNTLYFERNKSWKGLLIEADPANFQKLGWKNRKSWSSPTCLSTTIYPQMVSFEQKENQGKITSFGAGYMKNGFVDVQCFPFETYMTALNITTIDYFSLDVEGLELEILKTIPFNKYDIRTLSVEFIHDIEGKEAIREFMLNKGYFVQTEVTHPDWLANDFIFISHSFYKTLSAGLRKELDRERDKGG